MKPEDDPVTKRIRDVRHKISAKFDHDPQKIVDHYIEYQKRFADRLEPMTNRGKIENPEPVTK